MRIVVQPSYPVLLLLMAACPLMTGCGTNAGDLPAASIPTTATSHSGPLHATGKVDVEPYALTPNGQEFQSPARSVDEFYPEVVIQTSQGELRVRLNAEKSPRTVDNFLYNYVDSGFYAQTVFHFVEQGYLIAGGGYTADLKEKPTQYPHSLRGEQRAVQQTRYPGHGPPS